MSIDRNIQLVALYQDIILEHRKDPRNFDAMEDADCRAEGFNPLCGDRVTIALKYDGEKVKKCAFQGEGCSICMASASMLTEEIEGKKRTEALNDVQNFRDCMQSKEDCEIEGDLEALKGVRNFPVRIKCALLPWTTLKDALEAGGSNGK